jgi:hypothetical protein
MMRRKLRRSRDAVIEGEASVEAGTTVVLSRTPQAMPPTAEACSFPRFSINSNLHTAQLHPQGDINDTMAKSKTQTDPKLTPKWQSVSWQKKDQQFASIPSQWRLPQSPPASVTNYLNIPRECGLLTEKEVDITEHYDATGLAQAIRERTFTCVDVTTAFCKVRVYYCCSKTHR